ncbi:MAG: topology modulation protein [Oscillospiraceae bacterium]|nr:topology modulation protein [Oscillospiraceae bacterium]
MERVVIIGCGGAGKSTLARQLGEKTGIPVVHLDQLWWKPDWNHISREEFDQIVAAETDKPQWIMDGNFDRTVELRIAKCDTIIYLDFNRIACLLSWIKRVIKNWGHARADMAEGCAEWFDPEMARWIWNFNKNNRERNYRLLNEAESVETIVLKNRRAVKAFLEQM